MANFKKSQLLTLSLITTLLFLTPLLSSSSRSTYLYFIINVLIVVLGAEAGLLSPTLSSSSSPSNEPPKVDTKRASNHIATPPKPSFIGDDQSCQKLNVHKDISNTGSEKIVSVDRVGKLVMKKCPSMPSIFFMECDEVETRDVEVEEEEEGVDDEELFVKAEVFIGNFYKQLKMQREESWNKLHGFHQNSVNV